MSFQAGNLELHIFSKLASFTSRSFSAGWRLEAGGRTRHMGSADGVNDVTYIKNYITLLYKTWITFTLNN
jgi:hypothetical protein